MINSIIELPFHERPLRELLNLVEDRDAPSRDYAGFGWAVVPQVVLDDGTRREVDNALLIAVHAADDAEPWTDDIDLAFELPDENVRVRLSKFLAVWLPKLPATEEIVLVACNPHRATLQLPVALHYGLGDVASWLDSDEQIRLTAETWCTLRP